MKLLSLNAYAPNFDLGLNKLNKFINEIFMELDIEVEEINIHDLSLPTYKGELIGSVLNLFNKIDESQGIILACTSIMNAPCSLMQNFLDYLNSMDSNNCFYNKNCMIVTISPDEIDLGASNYLSSVLKKFYCYDSVKININKEIAENIDKNSENTEILEKLIEDFYRIIRQNRKYFLPSSKKTKKDNTINNALDDIEPEFSTKELSEKLDLDSFSINQEEDIKEISNFFATKFEPTETGEIVKSKDDYHFENIGKESIITPREKTIFQMSKSLPHYFKAKISNDASFKMQIFITGSDNFEFYLLVENNSCDFFEGKCNTPDIVIYSDNNIWNDILIGKKTAQKSFMTGQLKVKGNFVILTKFDQLFEPMI